MTREGKLACLAALTAVLFVLSLSAGKLWVPPSAWFSGDPRWAIVAELRLPRAALGLAIGAVLGLPGAVLQGFLRNPLADPAVVGVSSSAALSAVALLAALTWRSASATAFVLAGTVLSSLAGALTAFLISVAPNPHAVAEVIDWLMGALADRGVEDLARAAPFPVAGAALLLLTTPSLDALTLGEDAARSLGVRLGRVRALVVLGTGLAVGASVAVTGWWGSSGWSCRTCSAPSSAIVRACCSCRARWEARRWCSRRRQPAPPRAGRGRGAAGVVMALDAPFPRAAPGARRGASRRRAGHRL